MNDKRNIDLFDRFKIKDDELDQLAGLPGEEHHNKDIISKVAQELSNVALGQTNLKAEKPAADLEQDRDWRIHKLFAELYKRHGKPFLRFLGDIIDLLLSGTLQNKFLLELFNESFARMRRRQATKLYHPTETGVPFDAARHIEPTLGGKPYHHPKHYLKRKAFLAGLCLEPDEYPAFRKLLRQIERVCRNEQVSLDPIPSAPEMRKVVLQECLQRLQKEISRYDVILAWNLLAADEFSGIEELFLKVKSVGLVRPTSYDDIDAAYREAKERLKQVIKELETDFPPNEEKRDMIMESLYDLLDVYSHHHFVLKHYNAIGTGVSRKDLENLQNEFQRKIESLQKENAALRKENQRLQREVDTADSTARIARQAADELQQKLQKLNPTENEKQRRALEATINQLKRELQATLDDDAALRKALREFDEENQELTRKLRELNALPDSTSKSVENLLKGKRVAIFGGIGRAHYWPVLHEAGVAEEDYEWYEGYHTIPQARTAEIVGRCDVVVVVTAYAGHLHLFQTRACIKDDQTLLLIHKSGAGSLREALISRFGVNRK